MFKNSASACEDSICPMGCGDETPEVETSFEIRVALSDHTGSLSKCRLSGSSAEAVLHCPVSSW